MTKLSAKWSNKHNDFIIKYPSGSAGCFLSFIVNLFKEELKKCKQDQVFDIKTLKISIEKHKDTGASE